jgi:Tfp pilus assembly protein PilF
VDRVEHLRRFVSQKPDEPFPRYALALELKGRGDGQAAARELDDLLKHKPDYLPAYLMLGLLQQSLGRIDDARAALTAGQEVARRQGNSHTLGELTSALEQLA